MLYFFVDLLIASLGVAIIESAVYPILPRPATISGIYAKELLISGGVAFVLGAIFYWKLNRSSSLWIWTLGICLFVTRVASGAGIGSDVLGFLSIRMVCYSLGAGICALTIGGTRGQETNNSQGVASLFWIFGVPARLPKATLQKIIEEPGGSPPDQIDGLRNKDSRGGEQPQP